MNFDLYKHTLLLVLTGSRGYGTNIESSDWDYRGIAVPPLDTYIGLNPRFEQVVDTEKKTTWKHYPEGMLEPDADMQVTELGKFCRLAMECNPSVIEILFSDKIIYQHPLAEKLIENRDLFLSRLAKPRFCGYALSQLSRIKGHKRWLDNPPQTQPARKDFGLGEKASISVDQLGAAEALVRREVDNFMIDQQFLPEETKIELGNGLGRMMRIIWLAINKDEKYPVGVGEKFAHTNDAVTEHVMRSEGFSEGFIEILQKEKRYRTAMKDWDAYQTWLKERNETRADLEKKFGYDTKHGMHLVRLLRMAREILETGKVNVWREDAEELKAIRNGAMTYQQLIDFADKEDEALVEVARNSKLPLQPDRAKLHKLVYDLTMEFNAPPVPVEVVPPWKTRVRNFFSKK
jgi:predicted nucleotidyltransferase